MEERLVAFDRFVLDRRRRTLQHDGKNVGLTPKALDILEVLVERANELVTKEELLEAIWPGEFVQESNLSQHVYLLRKALASAGGDELVKTVPRRGYRFVADAAPLGASTGERARPIARRRQPIWGRVAFGAAALAAMSVALAAEFGGIVTRPQPQIAGAALDERAERAYRLGRFFWQRRDEPDLRRSLAIFEQVEALAPRSPLGYSGASDALLQLAILEYPSKRSAAHAVAAEKLARKALDAAPASAEAHASYGSYLSVFRMNEPALGQRELERAIALDPNYASAHLWYGIWHMRAGNFARAIDELSIAKGLDPTSVPAARWLGFAYYYARQYDDAIRQLREALFLDPNNSDARLHLGLAYVMNGRVADGIETLQRLPLDQFDPAAVAAWIAYAHAVAGQPDRALAEIEQILHSKSRERVGALSIAAVLEASGRRDEALSYLRSRHRFDDDSASLIPRYDPRIADLMPSLYAKSPPLR